MKLEAWIRNIVLTYSKIQFSGISKNYMHKTFKVGIGVFTLQGYERRNKESKNVFVKHSNMKGNLCYHTMKGLTQQYHTI